MVKKLKELYDIRSYDDLNVERYADDISNKAVNVLDKAHIVYDFFRMIESVYSDMESGKDVLSDTYERRQFLAEVEIAETVFDDIVYILDECQDVIKEHLVGD